ncbi:uncharacterized protein B0H64DRAFT_386682 [Chaetomium fimeti]|uniref:2EXR domain-containing protein n=1 Tax=Chaetomium fimeti TaxID=1854472 RepID=A0AAE0LVJ9_9PEZI|nr:hypothetical protein B0H64DRAFT_386682 [Chaetomium fimeti]
MAIFHLFPLLPFELRALIWKLTVEPRTVTVVILHRHANGASSGPPGTFPEGRTGPGPVCVLSHVGAVDGPSLPGSAGPTAVPASISPEGTAERRRCCVWLNLDIATVFVAPCSPLDDFRPIAPLIKRVWVARSLIDVQWYYPARCDATLTAFVNECEIDIVCEDEVGAEAWVAWLREVRGGSLGDLARNLPIQITIEGRGPVDIDSDYWTA